MCRICSVYVQFAVLLATLLLGCEGENSQARSSDEPHSIAGEFVRNYSHVEGVNPWSNSVLGEATRLFSQDNIEQAHLYPLLTEEGTPTGYLVVELGDDQPLIPVFSLEGAPPTEELRSALAQQSPGARETRFLWAGIDTLALEYLTPHGELGLLTLDGTTDIGYLAAARRKVSDVLSGEDLQRWRDDRHRRLSIRPTMPVFPRGRPSFHGPAMTTTVIDSASRFARLTAPVAVGASLQSACGASLAVEPAMKWVLD